MSLIFAARDTDNGTKVCGELSKELSATNIQFHPLDITSKESIDNLRDHVRDRFGGLDVLINNSGVYLKVGQGTFRDVVPFNMYMYMYRCMSRNVLQSSVLIIVTYMNILVLMFLLMFIVGSILSSSHCIKNSFFLKRLKVQLYVDNGRRHGLVVMSPHLLSQGPTFEYCSDLLDLFHESCIFKFKASLCT